MNRRKQGCLLFRFHRLSLIFLFLILSMSTTVWTLGHSNHAFEAFFDLLVRRRIETVVDVRSSPYSAYASQFNREAFGAALTGKGIRYEFLGDLIGGRVDDDRFYDDQGHVLYGLLAQSPNFLRGIDGLLAIAQNTPTAIVCGEENPTHCHRRLLIGRVLGERGVEVVHLRGDGRAQSEAEVAAAENFQKTKGQLSLFDVEEPDSWRSTQSVSPKRTRNNFSQPCDASESAD